LQKCVAFLLPQPYREAFLTEMTLLTDSPSTRPLGLYVHVPFCATACSFCAFYQKPPHRSQLDLYLEALLQEIDTLNPPRPIDTIFFGGGTPGLLPAEDLLTIGNAILKQLPKRPIEWTVEMAPSVVKKEKLQALKSMGVNRLSMGVQSFKPEILENLGRRQSPKQIYAAYGLMREEGFDNINLDFMFALPGQTFETWLEDLNEAFALDPEHLSTYCLTLEEDTDLYKKFTQGNFTPRTAEEEREYYLKTWEALEDKGFKQYEVSNFSKPSYACQHNIHTWQMHEWIGIGPSAASQYEGKRYTHTPSLNLWSKGIAQKKPIYSHEEALTPEIVGLDSLIFGLRMNDGIHWPNLCERFPILKAHTALLSTLNDLESEGLLQKNGPQYHLTQEGRLVADAIGSLILQNAG
jgi:oxygen-independent coproporphyrinogen-3 oxidase